jgi:preprotein translocase subunit YajC
MIINQAWAQETAAATTEAAATAAAATPPNSTELLLWNVGFVVIMIMMFYFLLIRPQQKRYKDHAEMLKALKKGDRVVLQSGMIATIDAIANDNQEMTVEFLAGYKAQILRSAIAGTYDEIAKK